MLTAQLSDQLTDQKDSSLHASLREPGWELGSRPTHPTASPGKGTVSSSLLDPSTSLCRFSGSALTFTKHFGCAKTHSGRYTQTEGSGELQALGRHQWTGGPSVAPPPPSFAYSLWKLNPPKHTPGGPSYSSHWGHSSLVQSQPSATRRPPHGCPLPHSLLCHVPPSLSSSKTFTVRSRGRALPPTPDPGKAPDRKGAERLSWGTWTSRSCACRGPESQTQASCVGTLNQPAPYEASPSLIVFICQRGTPPCHRVATGHSTRYKITGGVTRPGQRRASLAQGRCPGGRGASKVTPAGLRLALWGLLQGAGSKDSQKLMSPPWGGGRGWAPPLLTESGGVWKPGPYLPGR